MSIEDLDKISKINYGELIKDIKKESGLTSKQLSILTGIPKSTIDKIASNQLKKGPTATQLLKLMIAGRYSMIKWLSSVLGRDVSTRTRHDALEAITSEELELLMLYRQLNNITIKKKFLLKLLREAIYSQQ